MTRNSMWSSPAAHAGQHASHEQNAIIVKFRNAQPPPTEGAV
jgi:hypothetical protein